MTPLQFNMLETAYKRRLREGEAQPEVSQENVDAHVQTDAIQDTKFAENTSLDHLQR